MTCQQPWIIQKVLALASRYQVSDAILDDQSQQIAGYDLIPDSIIEYLDLKSISIRIWHVGGIFMIDLRKDSYQLLQFVRSFPYPSIAYKRKIPARGSS